MKNPHRRPGVVVLNASYEPLGVVPIQRAMIYLIADRADIVLADGSKRLSDTFELPLVVAFRDYIRVPLTGRRTEARWSRRLMFQRDNDTCTYCGRRGNTVDHIIPRAHGGGDTWLNTIAACTGCNGKKADRTLHDSGMELMFQPKTVYREDVLMLAVAKIANESSNPEGFVELLPALAQ